MLLKKKHRKTSYVLLAIILPILVFACTSISDLPRRASDIDFVDHVSGTPSNRKYDYCANYIAVDKETMLEAVKYSLVKLKFDIKESNILTGVVRGEHGISPRDWNIVAGVYFKKLTKGVAVKIIVRTAVSTSLYQDENGTAKDWANKIISGIDVYLQRDLSKSASTMKCG